MAPKRTRRLAAPERDVPPRAARVERVLKPGKLVAPSRSSKKEALLKPVETSELLTTKGVLGKLPTLESPGEETKTLGVDLSMSSSSDSSSEVDMTQKRKKNLHSRARHGGANMWTSS